MARFTLEQVETKITKAFTAAQAKAVKDGVSLKKHDLIRAVLVTGASNQMALKVLTTHVEKPIIRMADVRWNRNKWLQEAPETALTHAAADEKELKATGTNLGAATVDSAACLLYTSPSPRD